MCSISEKNEIDNDPIFVKENYLLEAKDRMKIVNEVVQSKLRYAVNKLGWSDSEVARYSEQPQSTVYRLLNAKTSNPPFGLVYELCQTLGISLPLSNCCEYPTAPITLYIGLKITEPNNSENRPKPVRHVHILPEFRTLIVGEIIDDCANHYYPKESLLFISNRQQRLLSIKPKDHVIVRITNFKVGCNYIIPMKIMPSPDCGEWILHHMTDNKEKQLVVNLSKQTLKGSLPGKKVQVIGIIQKALI